MASSRAAGNTSLTSEPSVRFELTASPLPRARSNRWSYEGACWPTWIRTRAPASKVRWAAPTPAAIESPSPGSNWASGPYKELLDAGPKGNACARRDSNPQHPASRADLSARLEYEHMEPPPGVEPGHPRYEGGAAAVRGGVAAGQGLETSIGGFRIRCPAIGRSGIGTGAGIRIRSRALPGTRTQMFPGLRVRCIAIHARSAQSG